MGGWRDHQTLLCGVHPHPGPEAALGDMSPALVWTGGEPGTLPQPGSASLQDLQWQQGPGHSWHRAPDGQEALWLLVSI